MIPNSFSLGPFTIHIYGLIIALAILLGWWIVKKRAHQYKIDPVLFDNPLLLLPFILGIVGGRLYHVIDKWILYAGDPIKIIKVWEGGLGIFGALVGILIGFWFFAKIKGVKILRLLDLISPSLILGQAIGRIGNFVNQEGYSQGTPWPVYFHEAALEVIAFTILIVFSKKLAKPGQIFGLYLILYSISRSIAEIWRYDTAKIGDVNVAYLLAILASIIGIYLLKIRKN